MLRRSVWFLAVAGGALALPLPSTAQQPNTLALEAAVVSLSSDWQGEGPAGSGLLHRGDADGDETGFAVSYEFRATRHVGARVGFLRSAVPIRSVSTCPSPPCEFTSGPVRVVIGDVTWEVDEDSGLEALFLEVPFAFRAGQTVELFAGPTIARLELDDAVRSGLEGLTVNVDVASPSYGLHLGGALHFGRRHSARQGRFLRPWSAGLIARWIRADVDFVVSQPIFGGGAGRGLFTANDDVDLMTVGLFLGRRMGGFD